MSEDVPLAGQVHSVPARIEYNGPAKIAEFFESSRRQTADRHESATFRGRPLQGVEVEVPESYRLYIAEKLVEENQDNNACKLVMKKQFKRLNVWSLDEPADTAKLLQAIAWVEIAESISCGR
ncbi:Ribonuclease H2 subunit C [Trichinella sp. T6]|nr:Ribonuclease H2 subunit C [Trichinella sp. T6]